MRHRDQDEMRRQPDAFKPGFMDSVSTKHAPFSKTNSVQRPVTCGQFWSSSVFVLGQDYGDFRYQVVMPPKHTSYMCIYT